MGEYAIRKSDGQRVKIGTCESTTDYEVQGEPGIMQLRHESGLLLNVPCYHGAKLPEVVAPMKAFWNGKSWSIELYRLRPTPTGVKPVIGCRHCGEMWRVDWADIWDYIPFDMRVVLRTYQQQEQTQAQPVTA